MYYIDYVGFATCSQQFWELFLVNKPVHSVHVLGQSTMKTMIDQIFSVILPLVNQNWNAFSEGWLKAIWPKQNLVNTGPKFFLIQGPPETLETDLS